MRLKGKKAKDSDQKKETIDGLTRLVCTSRTQDVPLKGKFLLLKIFNRIKIFQFLVLIDGIEWKNIKFFQVSSQWQGHIKSLNLMIGSSN